MSDTKLYLGIEAGDASLKVALLDAAEKRVLKTAVLNTETSPLDDVFSFESALQDWVDENQIENIRAISVTIPAFRSIRIPRAGRRNSAKRRRRWRSPATSPSRWPPTRAFTSSDTCRTCPRASIN